MERIRRFAACSIVTGLLVTSTVTVKADSDFGIPIAGVNEALAELFVESIAPRDTEFPEEIEPEINEAIEIEETEEPEIIYVEDSEPYIYPDRSDSDQRMMARMAMAEAEGESTEGKALVIRVILNRVASEEFPNTVGEVIYQQGQFESITNGRYSAVEPNEDCWKAMEMVLNGWDQSCGAIYFTRSDSGEWHKANLQHLFTYQHHSFYKD